MSRTEKFIQDYTRNCSNEVLRSGKDSFTNIPRKGEYHPWLTPDQARRAVEIAREEIYEWLNKNLFTYIDYRCRGVGESVEEFVNDLKQAIKDE